MIGIHTPDQQTVQVKANADTGGSKNLANKHLLQNVKTTEEYGNKPICMVTIQGDSPAYTHQGELQFSDENKNPLILLCYVQERPIPGHELFVLISNNTLVDINADINFHARASKEIGVLPLRRTTSEAYHYQDYLDVKLPMLHSSNKNKNLPKRFLDEFCVKKSISLYFLDTYRRSCNGSSDVSQKKIQKFQPFRQFHHTGTLGIVFLTIDFIFW
jgi:hypothetical protein